MENYTKHFEKFHQELIFKNSEISECTKANDEIEISNTDETIELMEIDTTNENSAKPSEETDILETEDFIVIESPIDSNISEIAESEKNTGNRFKCPLCVEKFNSEESTMNHLWDFHRFTPSVVSKLGLKIEKV